MRLLLTAVALTEMLLSTVTSQSLAAGGDGAAFLQIPAGARPAALGGAFDALSTDAYAPAWNPGGLGFATTPGVAATYLRYVESMSYDALSAVVPLRSKSSDTGRALGATLHYFSPGTVAGADAAGNPTGDFHGYYGLAGLSYGQTVGKQVALGVTGKAVNAKIAGASATAFAADVGALVRATPKVSVSAVAANLGTRLKFAQTSDSLPRQFRLGAAARAADSLTLCLQGLHDDNGLGINAGGEWRPLPPIALRAGYQSEATKDLSSISGLTLGMGLKIGPMGFDYGWLPLGELGMTNHFTLTLAFGPRTGPPVSADESPSWLSIR